MNFVDKINESVVEIENKINFVSKEDEIYKKLNDIRRFINTEIANLFIKTDLSGKDLINVFVPTTPNPTSGFLLMVPKKDLIYLDVTFEQASKFIVSAGTTNIN